VATYEAKNWVNGSGVGGSFYVWDIKKDFSEE
jgi:hypothetical protein